MDLMKQLKSHLVAGFVALAMAFAGPSASAALSDLPSGKYDLDKTHAYITFSYMHLGFSKPTLAFRDFEVMLDLDTKKPSKSDLSVTVGAASIDSGVPGEFYDHLIGERFFNIAEHPLIMFKATKIKMTSDNTADVTGDLTIKGITKPVTLDVTLNNAMEHPMAKVPAVGFSGSATVKRSEFDLGYAVPFVGDEIEINVQAELRKSE